MSSPPPIIPGSNIGSRMIVGMAPIMPGIKPGGRGGKEGIDGGLNLGNDGGFHVIGGIDFGGGVVGAGTLGGAPIPGLPIGLGGFGVLGFPVLGPPDAGGGLFVGGAGRGPGADGEQEVFGGL